MLWPKTTQLTKRKQRIESPKLSLTRLRKKKRRKKGGRVSALGLSAREVARLNSV